MQARALARPPHQYHGFDILNIDSITKQYPAVRPEVLKHDVIQWFNMQAAQRSAHVDARVQVQVTHTIPQGVSCAARVCEGACVCVCVQGDGLMEGSG